MLDLAGMEQLAKDLTVTAEVLGDEARPAVLVLMVNELSSYPLASLQQALATCRRELKGRLTLAAILERIDDGHLAPNEAWAVALPAWDEENTVVWTEEVASAWLVARPLLEGGDRVAARLAFLEAYGRNLKAARNAKRPAAFIASLGRNAAVREAALQQAVNAGLLEREAVAQYLLDAPGQPAFDPAKALAGVVEPSPSASAATRARIDALQAELSKVESP